MRPDICISTTKHNTASPGKADKVGRGTNHGHILFAGPELVSRNNETGNRITEEISALRVAFVQCSHWGTIPKVMRDIMLNSWKLLSQSARNGIAEEIARKITNSWARGTRGSYQ